MGHLYQRGSIWWFQFYQDGQRQRITSESTDEAVARRMLKEHEARVTLKEPLVARTARVTYDELRAGLVAHYQATGSRDLTEAGWRLKHPDRAFRGVRASQITAAAITTYIARRQQDEIVSPKTKQRRHPTNGTIVREVSVLLKMLRLGVGGGAARGFLEPAAFEAVRALFPIFPGPGIPHKLVGTQRDNFERVWARACTAAGFPGTLVHDLRRSGIRNLVRAGVPERVVMSISGTGAAQPSTATTSPRRTISRPRRPSSMLPGRTP